jgi:hypothetical protein
MPGKYTGTKIGRLWPAEFTNPNTPPAYFPQPMDTTDIVASSGWPWSITVITSSLHSNALDVVGVYIFGCKTGEDPAVLGSWESYTQARLRGAFDAWATATGQTLPTTRFIFQDPDLVRGDQKDGESPCCHKIDGVYYMTYHVSLGGNNQPTRMATATGGPLNFTRINNGRSGNVIDSAHNVTINGRQPYSIGTAHFADADTHKGYFRWAPSPLPNSEYAYYGTGLNGGSWPSYSALYGHNDPTDGSEWTPITSTDYRGLCDYSGNVATAGHLALRDFIAAKDAGGGEICVPYAAGGHIDHVLVNEYMAAGDNLSSLHTREVDLERDRIIALGGEADYDYAIRGGGMVLDPTNPSRYIVIYMGTAVDYVENVTPHNVMLATAVWEESAPKPPPVKFPRHTKHIWTASGATALPDWLTASEGGGNLSFNSDGMRIQAASNTTIVSEPIPLAGVSFLEFMIDEYPGGSTDGLWSSIWAGWRFGNTFAARAPDCVEISSRPNDVNRVGFRYETDSVVHLAPNSTNKFDAHWPLSSMRAYQYGLRWMLAEQKILFLVGPRGRQSDFYESQIVDVAAFPGPVSESLRFAMVITNNRVWHVKRVQMRIGYADAPMPTVTNVSITAPNKVLFEFSEDLIGDATGITIKDSGNAVEGFWTRPTLDTAEFTQSFGTWIGALSYSISNTDLRS